MCLERCEPFVPASAATSRVSTAQMESKPGRPLRLKDPCHGRCGDGSWFEPMWRCRGRSFVPRPHTSCLSRRLRSMSLTRASRPRLFGVRPVRDKRHPSHRQGLGLSSALFSEVTPLWSRLPTTGFGRDFIGAPTSLAPPEHPVPAARVDMHIGACPWRLRCASSGPRAGRGRGAMRWLLRTSFRRRTACAPHTLV